MTTMANRIILITGANRGIGFSIAQALGTTSHEDVLLVGSRSKASATQAIGELRKVLDFKAVTYPVTLDVTNENDIEEAKHYIQQEFGRLDVLINNAGIARQASTSTWDTYKFAFRDVLETNVAAVGYLTAALDPLLRMSAGPRVINISSGRASMARSSQGRLPPTAAVAYSVSKVALNALTLEMIKAEAATDAGGGAVGAAAVQHYVANPGHCKTELNGYRGAKDPLDGAKVVVELALADAGKYAPGFWECEVDGMQEVPW